MSNPVYTFQSTSPTDYVDIVLKKYDGTTQITGTSNDFGDLADYDHQQQIISLNSTIAALSSAVSANTSAIAAQQTALVSHKSKINSLITKANQLLFTQASITTETLP